MRICSKYYFPLLVATAAIIIMGMPVSVFSGGSTPERINSISDSATQKAGDRIESDTLDICSEPRPQMCTMDYRPVCAQMMDGSSKTYSNGCTSCSDPNVSGYRDGACEEAK